MTTTDKQEYAFEQPGESAEARFDALATLYDQASQRYLLARGLVPGWRCLDVGAGGGSIARWLSEQVGPTGHVLATDLNTEALEQILAPNLEVRRHDAVRDQFPDAEFDLIHTRLVLVHIAERERVLEKLFAALKPGGWLVAEEFDGRSMLPDPSLNPAEADSALLFGIQEALIMHGADPRFGRFLPGRLCALGMQDVGAEGRVILWRGGSTWAGLHKTNALRVRSDILSAGLRTEEEFERELALLDDPNTMGPSPIMWTVWGRRPEE